MTYGQQPMNGSPYGQQPYGQQPMNYANTINVQASQSYERAEHVSVTRAYGEMCLGLLVTAAMAIFTQMSGFYMRFLQATGGMGMWILAIVEIGLAISGHARDEDVHHGRPRCFYVYAALMGVTLSTIFLAYDLGTIGIAFLVSAGFYFALTMFGLTTKGNMLKAGPILMIALVVHHRRGDHDVRGAEQHDAQGGHRNRHPAVRRTDDL